MSYNCDGAEYLSGKLYIDRATGQKLIEEHGDDLPESSLLDYVAQKGADDCVEIKNPSWCGSGSNYHYPKLFIKILEHTKGTADIMLTWEGGDSFVGFRVIDGKVTQHEVVRTLGKKL